MTIKVLCISISINVNVYIYIYIIVIKGIKMLKTLLKVYICYTIPIRIINIHKFVIQVMHLYLTSMYNNHLTIIFI